MASLTEADTQGKKDYLIVGAIDLGTSYSGYAYSYKHAPETVVTKHWSSSTRGIITEKIPTCILFDKDKIFSQFGFKAEDEYWQRCDEGTEADWYFFRGFKLALYNEMCLMEDKKILDEFGREFPLLDVVSEAIRYLNNNLIADLKLRQDTFEETDVLRVITLPAIWSDSARNFMRKAAVKAGIPEYLLNICLEPEAAAIYCQTIHCKSQKQGSESNLVEFQPGDKYLVLDAGGGTVDIVVHEIDESGGVKELYPACGGDWGGTLVDKAFTDYISSCLGEEVFNRFRQEEKYDFMDVMREFENKKRSMVPESDENKKLLFRVPVALYTIYKDKQKNESGSTLMAEHINLKSDKMRLSYGTVLNFYSDSMKEIGNKVTDILANPSLKDVGTIIMVGGYSDSLILQTFIKEKFKQRTIIIPNEAAVAVLKGAVMFGHDPTIISERRCRFTYGIQTCMLFDKNIDQESKRIVDEDGNIRACDRFDIHVTIGQNVKTGVFQPSRVYSPMTGEQTSIAFRLYASLNDSPIYTDETGCEEINSRIIDISDLKGSSSEKNIEVSLCFSGPLITVKAVKKQTGETMSHKIKYQCKKGLSEAMAVCAINVGSIFSSVAFSFQHEPTNVHMISWHQYEETEGKVLNCILLDQNKKFHAFGTEAEELYSEKKKDISEDWFFFKGYTAVLYDKKVLKKETTTKDEQGRPFPLLPILSETVLYIVRYMGRTFGDYMARVLENEMSFVFLTPSGLTESARKFFSAAIEEAGISEEHKCFCSELEAIVTYCRVYLSIEFGQNKEYLALICEGDRVEFNVFSVDADGTLTGICDLGGGNWGTTMVYNQFIAFLYKIFGKNAIDRLTKIDSYVLRREFTYKMLSVRPLLDEHTKISMKIPNGLRGISEVYRDRQGTQQGLPSDIYFIADKMRFTRKKMLEFHEESLATIGNHLYKIFSMPAHTDISTVIMVGEYAESQILQDFIAKRFSSKKLIVPECAREAFLKGAVQFACKIRPFI